MRTSCLFQFVALFLIAAQIARAAETWQGAVVEVLEGSVLHVETADGLKKIRVIGLDTPGRKLPTMPPGFYLDDAKEKAEALLHEKTVTVSLDPADEFAGYTSRDGRLLAHITLPDGTSYAETMIRSGYSRLNLDVPFDKELEKRYKAAEKEAQAAKRGIWAYSSPPPVETTAKQVNKTLLVILAVTAAVVFILGMALLESWAQEQTNPQPRLPW